MALTLGIDVAVRAAHQATLTRDGKTLTPVRSGSQRSNSASECPGSGQSCRGVLSALTCGSNNAQRMHTTTV